MDFLFILQLARAGFRELWLHRYAALFGGFTIAVGILIYGMLWQEKYTVSTSLYADQQNIIAPLLQGQAQVTKVEDQLEIVEDLMLSNRILEKIVKGEDYLNGIEDPAQQSSIINGLRERIEVKSLGKNYIGVSFADVSPDRAYNLVTQLVDLFIKESSANKRGQSKQAFLFIEKQVASYKEQLRQAEDRLKEFNASNLDGSEGRVQGNIEVLRQNIADLELDLGQASERVKSFESQVTQEDRYLSRKARSEEFRERIAEAVTQLDNLKLSYTSRHPDVIALEEHIKALRGAASAPVSGAASGDSTVRGVENPVFDELRGALASAKVERDTLTSRLSSMRSRLGEERERASRIAERDAELAELTRDYSVTKGLYEDLLNSKEKARLSMTLDIEGQGVTYKIQEPAKYPLFASGLRFIHFALAGLAAAVVIPIGLILAYIFLDPRIRFSNAIEEQFDVPLLGEIPHLVSNPIKRMRKVDVRLFVFMGLVCAALYASTAAFYLIWM